MRPIFTGLWCESEITALVGPLAVSLVVAVLAVAVTTLRSVLGLGRLVDLQTTPGQEADAPSVHLLVALLEEDDELVDGCRVGARLGPSEKITIDLHSDGLGQLGVSDDDLRICHAYHILWSVKCRILDSIL